VEGIESITVEVTQPTPFKIISKVFFSLRRVFFSPFPLSYLACCVFLPISLRTNAQKVHVLCLNIDKLSDCGATQL